MPPDVVEHIDRAAASNCRSRSAEVLYRVMASMEGESFDVHGCIVKQVPVGVDAPADQKAGGQ